MLLPRLLAGNSGVKIVQTDSPSTIVSETDPFSFANKTLVLLRCRQVFRLVFHNQCFSLIFFFLSCYCRLGAFGCSQHPYMKLVYREICAGKQNRSIDKQLDES